MMSDGVSQALERYATPFFLFDEGELQAQAARIRSWMPANVQLCYAMKANSFVLEQMSREVERIEVCSEGEARSCFALGVPDEQLVISGVHKESSFIDEFVREHPHMCRYTVESKAHFDMLAKAAQSAGHPIRVLMRLTSGNQFGMTAAEVKELAQRCAKLPLVEFVGIQHYSGTQKTSLKRVARELRKIDSLIAELEAAGVPVSELEYGPGFPVSYYDLPEEDQAQLEGLACGLADQLGQMTFDGTVVLEIGRALVASCGTYATRVVDLKSNKTGNYAIVDGGKHQFVYYGNAMSMRQPPCQVLPSKQQGSVRAWNFCGSLCTVTDILVKQLEVQDLTVGDALVFERAGAYCMTEGISLFLSRDLPSVVMRDVHGSLRLARERIETYVYNTPGVHV
ncbi:MAG: alanine racemase [Atopobiaceae bacterium]|nr:alanine racemase [Atopobiaceae bacterium]